MKEIVLSCGRIAVVDDADFEKINEYRWFSVPQRSGRCHHTFYAVRRNSQQQRVPMHREIIGALPGFLVDHKNGDSLDNRRENLRIVTQEQNMANQRQHRDSRNPFKGIWHPKDCRGWAARVFCRGKLYHLGIFPTPELAAKAYDAKARELFGPFARVNFPEAA